MGSNAVVVGGGIGGLSAAIGLRKAGWQVTVLEREPGFNGPGAGISLWPNALRGLDELGVGHALAPHLRPQTLSRLRDPGGRTLTRMEGAAFEARFGKPLAGIHRAELIAVLRSELPDSAVRVRTPVRAVDSGGHVYGPDGLISDADLVVAADGINSAARASVLPEFAAPVFSGITAFRAITEARDGSNTGGILAPGVEFGTMPLPGHKLYLWVAMPAARARHEVDPGPFLRTRLAGWPADVRELIEETDPATFLHNDIDVLPAPLPSYSFGRVALLGDAAHPMTPFLGQGGCQAIEDAVVLAARLAGCAEDPAAVPAALAGYDTERRPRTQAIVRASDRMGRLGHRLTNPLAVAARNALIRLAPPAAMLRGMGRAANWTPPTINAH